MQGNRQINANEREDSEVVNEWEEQVRRERADREGDAEKASGSGEGHRESAGHRREAEREEDIPHLLGENESDEEQDAGDVRRMKKLIDPKLPSREEVDAHELTHLPYRNWCRHCVKGRGVEAAHRKVDRDEGSIPEIHVDVCFPCQRGGNRGPDSVSGEGTRQAG